MSQLLPSGTVNNIRELVNPDKDNNTDLFAKLSMIMPVKRPLIVINIPRTPPKPKTTDNDEDVE